MIRGDQEIYFLHFIESTYQIPKHCRIIRLNIFGSLKCGLTAYILHRLSTFSKLTESPRKPPLIHFPITSQTKQAASLKRNRHNLNTVVSLGLCTTRRRCNMCYLELWRARGRYCFYDCLKWPTLSRLTTHSVCINHLFSALYSCFTRFMALYRNVFFCLCVGLYTIPNVHGVFLWRI